MNKATIISDASGFGLWSNETNELFEWISAGDFLAGTNWQSGTIVIDGYDEKTSFELCQKIKNQTNGDHPVITYLFHPKNQYQYDNLYKAGIDVIQIRPSNQFELEIFESSITKILTHSLKDDLKKNGSNLIKERYSLAQKAGKAGLWDWDIRNNIFHWSPEFLELFGMEPDTVPGFEAWKKALHPDDVDNASKNIEISIKDKTQLVNYYRIVLPDGNIKWIQATGNTYYENDEPVRMAGFCVDISEYKTYEDLIIAGEKKFSAIFKNLAAGCCFDELIYENGKAVDYRLIDINPAFERILGLKRDQVVGRKASEVYGTKSVPFLDVYQRVVDTGIPESFETFFEPAGKFLHITTTCPEKGKFSNIFYDITDKKQNEDKIKNSEELYRLLAKNLRGISVMLFDLDLRYLLVEGNMHPDYMAIQNEMIGKTIFDILPPEKVENLIPYYQSTLDGIISEGLISEYKNYIYSSSFLPVKNTNNEIIGGMIVSYDITEKKRSEDILKNSEEKFRKAFRSHPGIIGISTLSDGKYIEVNKRFCKNLGWSYEEVIGHTSQELNVFENYTDREKITKMISSSGRLDNFEISLRTKSGELRSGFISAEIITIENQECLLLQFIDMTDLKKVEEKLINSEEQYSKIFNHVQDVFYETSIDGKILEVSPSIAILSSGQYHRDDLLGKSIFEYYAFPNERNKLISEITRCGFVNNFRIVLKNKDGSLINGSISSKIKKGVNGEKDTIVGSLRDVTDFVKTENALIQSEKHYKLITEKNTDVIWLMDLTGKSIFVSQSIERFTGFTISEYLNQTISDRFTQESVKKGMAIFSEELRKYKDNPKELKNYSKRLELEYVCKDGATKWGELIVSPYFVDGKLEGIHGVTRDITDRKRKEKELKAALEKAEESDLAKTTFLQNISHEIRTPMNAICGFADMINKTGTNSEKIKEYSRIIKNSSFQLLSVVNDILTVSSLENRKEEYNSGKVNINKIFSDLFAIFSPQTNSKGIEFALSLPLPTDKAVINTDGTKLTQIIANLISNSVKFTQSGKIEAGYRIENDSILFFVKDTGIGIKKEMQEVIFERFKQADHSISANYGGTGLGLSISREFANIIGGDLYVESEYGKGSSFFLKLKFAPEINDKSEHEIKPKQIFEKNKVLIADDEHVNIILIKEMFSGSEIEFVCASNGSEAVAFCQNDPEISLVLMDIKMPEMNGIEATQIIKKLKPELKVVALTAYGLDIEIDKYKDSGFDNYISKPVNYEVLMTLLKRYLS